MREIERKEKKGVQDIREKEHGRREGRGRGRKGRGRRKERREKERGSVQHLTGHLAPRNLTGIRGL